MPRCWFRPGRDGVEHGGSAAFPDFDPRVHYVLTLDANELSDVERAASGPAAGAAAPASSLDDIDLDIDLKAEDEA